MQDVARFTAEATLKDSRPVIIRAIRPSDREMIREAFDKLGSRSVFLRFFSRKASLTPEELTEITDVDFERTVALVATWSRDKRNEVIAGGRYIRLDDATENGAAEIAFTVRDDVQGQGLGRLMLGYLTEIARSHGIGRFEAEVLPQNLAMLGVFQKSNLPMERRNQDGIVHVTLRLARG